MEFRIIRSDGTLTVLRLTNNLHKLVMVDNLYEYIKKHIIRYDDDDARIKYYMDNMIRTAKIANSDISKTGFYLIDIVNDYRIIHSFNTEEAADDCMNQIKNGVSVIVVHDKPKWVMDGYDEINDTIIEEDHNE